jgi:hypothetical protein
MVAGSGDAANRTSCPPRSYPQPRAAMRQFTPTGQSRPRRRSSNPAHQQERPRVRQPHVDGSRATPNDVGSPSEAFLPPHSPNRPPRPRSHPATRVRGERQYTTPPRSLGRWSATAWHSPPRTARCACTPVLLLALLALAGWGGAFHCGGFLARPVDPSAPKPLPRAPCNAPHRRPGSGAPRHTPCASSPTRTSCRRRDRSNPADLDTSMYASILLR